MADNDEICRLKSKINELESALKVIWTWAHCYKTDTAPYKIQFELIEKKADEALRFV